METPLEQLKKLNDSFEAQNKEAAKILVPFIQNLKEITFIARNMTSPYHREAKAAIRGMIRRQFKI